MQKPYSNIYKSVTFFFFKLFKSQKSNIWFCFDQRFLGEVPNAENIKANLPKIFRPTHFSGMKDIKADSFSIATNINADMSKLDNKSENIDRYLGGIEI